MKLLIVVMLSLNYIVDRMVVRTNKKDNLRNGFALSHCDLFKNGEY